MNRRTVYITGLVILLAIATAAVLAYSTVWQQAMFAFIPFLSGAAGFILTIVALLILLRTRRIEPEGSNRFGYKMLLVGIFLLLQITYLPIGLGLRNREVSQAKDFTKALIPKLEEYKSLHGAYPDNLDEVLTGDEKAPRLLRPNNDFSFTYGNRQYYFQKEESYGFRFFLPDGFIGYQYQFCCGADGVWTVSD